MLSKGKEKLIKSLHTKKGREKSGFCLAEGEKVIEMAGDYVEFEFSAQDTREFGKLVSTETPQPIAAVARIPEFSLKDVKAKKVVVVLDGVQDPGNVGAILRLCLAFTGGLVLIESADVTNPKVIRSSAGAMFKAPWINVKRARAAEVVEGLNRPVFRLENTKNAKNLQQTNFKKPLVLIVGSEGRGIKVPVKGFSVKIKHEKALESLNVANALAITLNHIYNS